MNIISSSNVNPSNPPTPNWRNKCFNLNFFRSEHASVTPREARNILLVVATLIAAVTFQAGVSPPGGFWQDNEAHNENTSTGCNKHEPGTAIFATRATYYLFLICNTLGLSTALVMIWNLTHNFPLRPPMYLATICMIISYISAIYAVTPECFPHESLTCLTGFIPLVFGIIDYLDYRFASPTRKSKRNGFGLKFFRSEEVSVSHSEARDILLLVTTLIATVTFQAGLNPPGGVWQEDKPKQPSGKAIYASHSPTAYILFLIFNTGALSTAVVMILTLTIQFPLQVPKYVAIAGMMITYINSFFAVSPEKSFSRTFVCFVGFIPFFTWVYNLL